MATWEMKELRGEVYRPKEQPTQLYWSKDTGLLELEERGQICEAGRNTYCHLPSVDNLEGTKEILP